MPKSDWSFDLLCHTLHGTTFAEKFDGLTFVRKPFLDFRQHLAGMCLATHITFYLAAGTSRSLYIV